MIALKSKDYYDFYCHSFKGSLCASACSAVGSLNSLSLVGIGRLRIREGKFVDVLTHFIRCDCLPRIIEWVMSVA